MSIDDRVSIAQIRKAVKSLSIYAANKKKEIKESGKVLFDDEDENVWLVVTTKTMSPSLTLKPQRIPLAYPVIDPRVSSVCLITKDPQRAYKDLLQSHSIKFISRVVGISKLKGKFSPYDARRQLAKEHGLFLADERVIPLLPTLLGKAFFKKKKQPIPVNLLKRELKSELEKAISSTYMHQNAGTCLSIKIGHTGMDTHKLLANAEKAIPAVIRKLCAVNKKRKKGEKEKAVVKESTKSEEEKLEEREEAWKNIQSLGIKTHASVCLPIWSCALNDRWVIPTPTAAASSKEKGTQLKATKALPKGRGSDDDDTMSEGDGSDDNEEEKRLSQKLANSSLDGRVKAAKRSGDDLPPTDSQKQKKRKMDEGKEEKHGAPSNEPTKKSKKIIADSVVQMSHETVKRSKEPVASKGSPSTSARAPAVIAEKASEKKKKMERPKATDFMEEEEDAPMDELQIPKKKHHSASAASPFAAADATLKAHKKAKQQDKVSADPSSTVTAVKATLSTTPDEGIGVHKEKKQRTKLSNNVGTTNSTALPVAAPPDKLISKSSEKPSSTGSLKSALKKPSLLGSTISPSEPNEKRAKKATFSVIEKRKEKISKSVISGGGGTKSGKGGKSKVSLVGRGPKM